MITAFPKIFALGTDYIASIFDGDVEITEKIDGSQFVFGKTPEGELLYRSKGAIIYDENTNKMFENAVLSVQEMDAGGYLEPGRIYYCEYLNKPKHNVLAYDRIPRNHLCLFASSTFGGTFISDYNELGAEADTLGIDVAPLIYRGKVDDPKDIFGLIERESYLGGPNMEGCVVKNYTKDFLLGGQSIRVMSGKYVSEKFKEVHREKWGKENTGHGKWQVFKSSFRTEARWDKAIQRATEAGAEHSPRLIGGLIKEIQQDIRDEQEAQIKEWLYKNFVGEINRTAVKGFPEYYKKWLITRGNDESI